MSSVLTETDDYFCCHVTRDDLAAAERTGLVVRANGGVRLTEFGWNVAAGLGEALPPSGGNERVTDAVADVVGSSGEGVDPLALQRLAQVLVWLGGPRGLPTDMLIDEYGEDQSPRVLRELRAAEQAGIVVRGDGTVRLTDRGWAVAAADESATLSVDGGMAA
jgi:hypothetical protein